MTQAASLASVGSSALSWGGAPAAAWVNFDGTLSGTITPRASFNVTNITKNGTGDYTLNFTTAMPNTNYVTVAMCSTDSSAPTFVNMQGTTGAVTTSSVRIQTNTTVGSVNRTTITVAIFSL